ncbi:MAG: hypothetical protein A2V75_01030 [Actinobacteria bacterium RBG_16_70_17]|nr:MAG: hypothetical protein A2V75_01030 [Actinobacteria bacterium RBG_16_70_17]
MSPADPEPLVLLATLGDPAAAELCAALLRSEGIDSRLRGESLGPYRLTIGDMAATQVWVPVTRLDDARSLVLQENLGDIELAQRGEPAPAPAAAGPGLVALVLGVVVVGLALWLLLTQLL